MTPTEAVKDLAKYLEPHLKPGIDAESYAADLIASREPNAAGDLNLEVPGRYTVTGNPLPVTITAPQQSPVAAGEHTPGPWRLLFDDEAREERKSGVHFEIEKDGFLIQGVAAARDEHGTGYFSNDVARANARLIAAAPDMLAALQGIQAWFNDNPHVYDDDNDESLGRAAYAVDAAIARATGKGEGA